MRSYGLRRRLVLAMLFAFFLGLAGASAFYWIELQELREDLVRTALRHQADVAAQLLVGGQGSLTKLPPEWNAAYARPDSQLFFTLYAADRHVIERSPNLASPLPSPFGLPLAGFQRGRLQGQEVRFLTLPLGDGRLLQVARSDLTTPGILEAVNEEAIEFIVYTLLPFALLSVAAIWLVVSWSLRPVLRASEVARRITPDRPGERVPTSGLPSELRPLVDATNGALARLTTAYDAIRRLTADAAHELRTPLAALTLRLQRSRLGDPMDWPAIDRDLGHLRRLVQQMILLARRDSPQASQHAGPPVPVNLSRLAREVASLMLPIAEQRGRAIEVEAAEPIPVLGREDELHDLLRNLVENALDHGVGRVVIEASRSGASAVLAVSDEGPGIAPELGHAAFDRFRKADAASPGAGLGLAIVRRVAEHHDAQITMSSGKGFRIAVTFRLAPG